MRPTTPLAVENGVGKLAAKARQMPAREREHGELPSPNLSLLNRKVEQGLFVCTNGAGRETFNTPHSTPNAQSNEKKIACAYSGLAETAEL
jgi:hypothetical protein